ncbi:MAG: tyrosine-type recombinase/integrase [Paracoccaceae bacterium]
MPLTDVKLRNLKPREKPYKLADSEGLYVLVNPGGSRLWRLKYRIGGKEKLLALGKYPEVGLQEARSMRLEARREIAAGVDPAARRSRVKAKRKVEASNTFARIADEYRERMQKEGKAEITLQKLDWLLGMAKAQFGSVPITDLAAPEILRLLRKVEARGNYETARRLRSSIGRVFRYAVATGRADGDPTYALKGALITPKVQSRAAITDKPMLGGLLRAIAGLNGQPATRIALELLALLYPRPGELRRGKWVEFDLEGAIWTVPAERMKMRRPHRVPLPKQAVRLVDELRQHTGHRDYLFPSLRTPRRPLSENTLNAALRRMGYSGDEMTSHGFRATFSTIANESGLWNPDAIERALAHVENNEVRRAYARGEHWEERKRMADWWAGLLDELRASTTEPPVY